MLTKKSTLTQFLIEERRSHPTAVGDLNSLIIDLALSVKQIGVRLARAPFDRDPDAPNSRTPTRTPAIVSIPTRPAWCCARRSGAEKWPA